MPFENTKFDPAIAFAPIVSSEPQQPQPRQIYDPWADDSAFMGRPRPIEDISQVDFRDAEFRQFARNELKTPRKISKLTYRDPLMAAFDNEMILGKSDE
jgi:hypothetical protein